jgi:hypothetical protein
MKCLHPQSAHSDIIYSTEDTEVRRCTIGICLCLISSKKEKDVTHSKKKKRKSKYNLNILFLNMDRLQLSQSRYQVNHFILMHTVQ